MSVTMLTGASIVFMSGESEFGKNVLSTSKTKHKRLFFSRRVAVFSKPPVTLEMSRPVKELTVPVLPPMLEGRVSTDS